MTTRFRPDTTSSWSAMRASEIGAALANLHDAYTFDELAALVVNTHLNDWVSSHADDNSDPDKQLERLTAHAAGKRIPYIGWYWRATDWVLPRIPIANCGEFIGVCENNKWGFDQRDLTLDEAAQVTALIWQAKCVDEQSNSEAADVNAILTQVWDLFQTFVIPPAPWNQ